jgi:hypothetical protein
LWDLLLSTSPKTLINGFNYYRHNLAALIILRRDFARERIRPNEPRAFLGSLIILGYGIALCYVVLLPFIIVYSWNIEKSLFSLQMLIAAFFSPFLWHLIIKCLGGAASLKGTLAVQCMWVGLTLPLFTFACIPFWLHVTSYTLYPLHYSLDATMPLWSQIYLFVIGVTYGVLYVEALDAWITDLHCIGKVRFGISLCLLAIIATLFKPLGSYLNALIYFMSEMLQKIL